MDIKIKYHVEGLEEVEQNGDWIDLRSAEDVELKQGDFKIISLGVSMKLPYGYEAHLAPRSSTFKKWGIIQTNSVGIIDNAYCGEEDIWGMPVYATRDIKICKNDRICQFRLIPTMGHILIKRVNKMPDNKSRGGFGSTGIN